MKNLLVILFALLLCLPASATTIAYDGKYFAADTQCTSGSCKNQMLIKIVYSEKRKQFLAFSGTIDATYTKIIQWFLSTDKTVTVADIGLNLVHPAGVLVDKDGTLVQPFSVLIVDPAENACYSYGGTMSAFVRMVPPVAVGSGGDVARGAMAAGVDAVKAVIAAGQVDLYTNTHVVFIDLEEFNKNGLKGAIKSADPVK